MSFWARAIVAVMKRVSRPMQAMNRNASGVKIG